MGIEIERKYLLKNDNWKALVAKSGNYKQGYLQTGVEGKENSSVRVRIADDKATLNIKSTGLNVKRLEFEYEIPLHDAEQMLASLCNNKVVEKTRYIVPYGGHTWEIDVFAGDNDGLVVAEVELSDVNEEFEKPDWLAEEVSDDIRYYNSHLLNFPYKMWSA
jgi:adenylate cyclase